MFHWESAPDLSEWMVCSFIPLHLFVSGLHVESHLLKMTKSQDAININNYAVMVSSLITLLFWELGSGK